MKYEIINSSSSGNAIVIEDFFLLDCGVIYSRIKPYLKKIKLIFISHCHSDHLKDTAIKRLSYDNPNIKFLVGSKDLVKKLVELGVKPSNIYALPSNKWYDMGMLKVKLEKLIHDVPNHLCKFEIRNKKGIYIVDTGNVDNITAKDYDLYLIEANYQQELLKTHQIELDSSDKYDHLYRVEQAHLSFEQANSFLIENMSNKSNFEYVHKSDYNFESEE